MEPLKHMGQQNIKNETRTFEELVAASSSARRRLLPQVELCSLHLVPFQTWVV